MYNMSGHYDFTGEYKNITNFTTNSHMQYNVHLLVFQSVNNQIHRYAMNATEQFTIDRPVEVLTFTNMGLLERIYLHGIDGGAYTLTVFGPVVYESTPTCYTNLNMMQAYYRIDMITECEHNGAPCADPGVFWDLINQYNEMQQNLSFSYTNSNNIGGCSTTYVNDQWVHGSCNVQPAA